MKSMLNSLLGLEMIEQTTSKGTEVKNKADLNTEDSLRSISKVIVNTKRHPSRSETENNFAAMSYLSFVIDKGYDAGKVISKLELSSKEIEDFIKVKFTDLDASKGKEDDFIKILQFLNEKLAKVKEQELKDEINKGN